MNSIKQNIPSEYFNGSAVAIFIITPAHELIFWNKACEILTGTTSLEMLNTKKNIGDHSIRNSVHAWLILSLRERIDACLNCTLNMEDQSSLPKE